MDIFLICAVVLCLCATVYFLIVNSRKAGNDSAVRENQEEIIDDVHTAKLARDRLESDADYAARVRDKFTRE